MLESKLNFPQGEKGLKGWLKSQGCYQNVESKKSNNVFGDKPSHIAKTKCHNQNKGRHTEPRSKYPWGTKKDTLIKRTLEKPCPN
jgi:hypothetical protein